MEIYDEIKTNNDVQELSLAEKFSKLFRKLECCGCEGQKQIIEEMNGLVDRMNEEELESVYAEEMFNKINKMNEDKKLPLENEILLLKSIGYCKALKNKWSSCVNHSQLRRFERMIIEEEKKKEEKNEKLLVNLCECDILLNYCISPEMISICVPCLLKVASKKEENEEAQKEVEMALLALSCITQFLFIERELYLKEITEIIEHQQKHRNLSQLAYQSTWDFLIYRHRVDYSLEGEILNEMHFGREATKELEELTRNVDWKKKEEEMNKEEANEVLVIRRWIQTLAIYFFSCQLRNEEFVGLFISIVQVYRAARQNKREISDWCICSLFNAAERRVVKVEDLLKGGVSNAFLEEIHQPTMNKEIVYDCLQFFMSVSNRLEKKNEDEKEEMKRNATKRKFFEEMEEEGYEDVITSFHETLEFFKGNYNYFLSLNISDYSVYI